MTKRTRIREKARKINQTKVAEKREGKENKNRELIKKQNQQGWKSQSKEEIRLLKHEETILAIVSMKKLWGIKRERRLEKEKLRQTEKEKIESKNMSKKERK